MADKKISQLTAASTPLAGTEVLPIVQSGSTVKASVNNVQDAPYAAGVANGVLYLNGSKVASSSNKISWDTNIFKTIGVSDGAGIYLDATSNPLKIIADDRTGGGYGTLGLYVNNGGSAVQRAALSNGELKLVDTNLQFGLTGKGITDANNNELVKFTTVASAINEFTILNAGAGSSVTLAATGDDTDIGIAISPKGGGRAVVTNLSATSPRITTAIADANGNEAISLTATASAVNEFTVANAATGNAPTLSATGSDTNIDITISPKGSGEINMSKVDIDGGAIDGTPIGANSASTGAFTTVNGTNTFTLKQTVSTGSATLTIFSGSNSTTNAATFPGSASVNGVDGTPNASGLMLMWRDSGNLRSISAAGSINASGLDYAEYMVKSGDFALEKGEIAGIDAKGKLTNKFADSVAFLVKSTNPSYVGGDTWFNEPAPNAEDTKALAEWKQRMEAARATVDRMAFAGQVPVNVLGAKPGDYIVPANDGGKIKGVAVSSPTFEQYKDAVGRVISIGADGRATILVKVA